ncbi:RES family NAD+ phosphorylase [Ramlibacter humi]|uniref:RES domain-containing protein n=1 Tax=Ramlibacter humi TaxID=2530451 RepID=A0A4Z0BJU0_9BURK|nr:RES family NAD+ phosphorylase [Ramlibacter humi]TFY99070.1 RES domain-containing protein [Ramlibacter humi]
MTSVWRIGWNGALKLNQLPGGSALANGRWHVATSRLPIVYAAGTRALCQLEKRVHCNGVAPANMALLRLELPKGAVLQDAEARGLAKAWRQDEAHTQALGTAWAGSDDSLGLWVPSFVEPAERNLVLNPRHPQYAAVKVVVEANPFRFDPRLFS